MPLVQYFSLMKWFPKRYNALNLFELIKIMKIGLLGVGTVGGGVVNVLKKNSVLIKARTGGQIEIVCAAVKSISEPRICEIDETLLTEDAFEVVNHPDVEVVLELMGGVDFAKELVTIALKNNKHVITANKALIATCGNELLQLANQHQVALLFEASVAGGIPIIKSIQQGLSANKIQMLAGIINGTGNFILSEMTQKNRDFADVLTEAQALGYAEADPAFDVQGTDAAHKLAILSSLSFGHQLAFDQVVTQGISHIEPMDIVFAQELGYVIKHLGIAKQTAQGIQMRVHPTLIPKQTLLAQVNGVMNAVLVQSNAVGQTLYYGAGAGAEATASAVIADLIDIMNQAYSKIDSTALVAMNYATEDEMESIYYLRLLVNDNTGVLADISKILSQNNISIETVIQRPDNQHAHIVIITNKITTGVLQLAINQIEQGGLNQQKIQAIQVDLLH